MTLAQLNCLSLLVHCYLEAAENHCAVDFDAVFSWLFKQRIICTCICTLCLLNTEMCFLILLFLISYMQVEFRSTGHGPCINEMPPSDFNGEITGLISAAVLLLHR